MMSKSLSYSVFSASSPQSTAQGHWWLGQGNHSRLYNSEIARAMHSEQPALTQVKNPYKLQVGRAFEEDLVIHVLLGTDV